MINNSNWTEWSSIQREIARLISKPDEREVRGRLEVTSTINNGNRTQWSPIRSVIILVYTKSNDHEAGVHFINHEYDYGLNWTTRCFVTNHMTIDHFTVVALVTWPLNCSEAGVDLVLIQTSLFLLCKSSWSGLYQSKVTSILACIHGQVTKHTTVKWPITIYH